MEQPNRSTETLIDIMERDNQVKKGALRRSTLDRHLDRASKSRRMLGVLGQKRHVRLFSQDPLDFSERNNEFTAMHDIGTEFPPLYKRMDRKRVESKHICGFRNRTSTVLNSFCSISFHGKT